MEKNAHDLYDIIGVNLIPFSALFHVPVEDKKYI